METLVGGRPGVLTPPPEIRPCYGAERERSGSKSNERSVVEESGERGSKHYVERKRERKVDGLGTENRAGLP